MKYLVGFFLIAFSIGPSFSFAQTNPDNSIFQAEDRRIAEEIMNRYASKSTLPLSALITEIGQSFLGTTYVAATLENGLEEKLVINLRELDCTTFIEYCLALARTLKSGKTDFESFASELERIRYRDGIRNQYLSRLHYFSEWIHNNHIKNIVDESPNQKGVKLVKPINFMSAHADKYPVLKAHPELIPSMAEQEKQLSATPFYFFPKSDPEKLVENLKHGDIIGLTTSIAGLDITHIGFIVRKNGQFLLLHASQTEGKVVISDSPVTDFIKPESKNSGIVIARPIF
jgi:hypothetical protein